MRSYLKKTIIIILLLGFSGSLSAQEQRERNSKPVLQGYAAVSFPIQPDFESYEVVGYGGNINVLFPMKKLYPLYFGGNLGYSFHKLRMENSLSLVSLALNTGVAVDITNRFQLTAGVGGGGYAGFLNGTAINPDTGDVYPNQSGAALFWQASLGTNFFLSPSFSLGIFGSFDHYVGLFYGVRAGIFASLYFEGIKPNVQMSEPRIGAVYPSLSRAYDDRGLALVEIKNNERFPMEDVTVNYQIDQLMEESAVSASIPVMTSGETASADLLTLLGTNGLLQEADEPMASTITLEYRIGNKQYTIAQDVNVQIMNRNALVWDDDRKVASFIDTKDHEVLKFSKEVSRLVMNDDRKAVNPNLRASMAMFEAMGAYRISYVKDPHSPAFVDAYDNTEIIDFIQYPNQTLLYRGGDCDDLSILYCSLLESIGVETALITVPGHIYPAVNLAVPPSQADKLFPDTDGLVIHEGSIWLPVEITMVGQDFQEALDLGARQWNEADTNGRARIFSVGEAWTSWENTGSPFIADTPGGLDIDEVEDKYTQELDRHLSIRLASLTEPLEARLDASPGDPRILNRLGIVYAGHGLLDSAEGYFRDAASDSGYRPAEVNLGNVYILRDRPDEAMAIFESVLDENPQNKVALAGMAKAGSMAGEQMKVEVYLAELNSLDPDMGVHLAALSQQSGTARASGAMEGGVSYWADED